MFDATRTMAASYSTLLAGTYYPGNRGYLYSSAIFLYALTASVAGFVAARLFKLLNGGEKRWFNAACLTSFLFVGPTTVVFGLPTTATPLQHHFNTTVTPL
jgi:hypothetical protein